jgi:hypothetical protein
LGDFLAQNVWSHCPKSYKTVQVASYVHEALASLEKVKLMDYKSRSANEIKVTEIQLGF